MVNNAVNFMTICLHFISGSIFCDSRQAESASQKTPVDPTQFRPWCTFKQNVNYRAKIFRKRMSGLSSEPWGPLCPKFWTSNRIVLRLHLLKWPNMKEFCILTLFSPRILLLWILTFNKDKTRKFRDVRASKISYSMSQSKSTTNPRIGKDEQILMKIYV